MGYKNPTLGVMLAVVGCCCSATGYTLQKLAHRREAMAKEQSAAANHHHHHRSSSSSSSATNGTSSANEAHMNTTSSGSSSTASSVPPPLPYYRYWQFLAGVIFLIIGAVFSVIVFSLAGQSELAPMGAVTMIANQLYAKFVLKENFTRIDVIATALMALGTSIAIIFSVKTEREYDLEQLFMLLNRTEAIIGTVIMVSCLVLGAIFLRFLDWHLKRKEKELHNLRQELPHLDPTVPDILNNHQPTTTSSTTTTTTTTGNSSSSSLTVRGSSGIPVCTPRVPVIHFLGLTNMEKSLDCIGRAIIGGFVGGYTGLTTKSFVELAANAFVNGHWENLSTVQPYGFLLALVCCLYFQLYYLNSGLARHDSARVIPLYQSSLIFASVFSGWLYFDEIAVQTSTSLILFGIGVLITTSGMLLLIRKSTMQTNTSSNSGSTSSNSDGTTIGERSAAATPVAIEMTVPSSKYDKHNSTGNSIDIVMYPSSLSESQHNNTDHDYDDEDHIYHQNSQTHLVGSSSLNNTNRNSKGIDRYGGLLTTALNESSNSTVPPLIKRAASLSYRPQQQSNTTHTNYLSHHDDDSSSTVNHQHYDNNTDDDNNNNYPNKDDDDNNGKYRTTTTVDPQSTLLRIGKQLLSGITPLPGLSSPKRGGNNNNNNNNNNSGTSSHVSTPIPSKLSSIMNNNVPQDLNLPYPMTPGAGPSYVSFHSAFSEQDSDHLDSNRDSTILPGGGKNNSSSSSNSLQQQPNPLLQENNSSTDNSNSKGMVMNGSSPVAIEVSGVNITSLQPRQRKIGE